MLYRKLWDHNWYGVKYFQRSSCHIPLFQLFLNLKIKFKIQHIALSMNSNDSDLAAFESNFCASIQARDLDKNATLVPSLC